MNKRNETKWKKRRLFIIYIFHPHHIMTALSAQFVTVVWIHIFLLQEAKIGKWRRLSIHSFIINYAYGNVRIPHSFFSTPARWWDDVSCRHDYTAYTEKRARDRDENELALQWMWAARGRGERRKETLKTIERKGKNGKSQFCFFRDFTDFFPVANCMQFFSVLLQKFFLPL